MLQEDVKKGFFFPFLKKEDEEEVIVVDDNIDVGDSEGQGAAHLRKQTILPYSPTKPSHGKTENFLL
jgi:hypothetical protein